VLEAEPALVAAEAVAMAGATDVAAPAHDSSQLSGTRVCVLDLPEI